jgi:ribonuclease BN (tRNA processing enzyme)
MELTILGTGGTWPGPGGATSGYLVQHHGFNLWVDAGTGTFARLQDHIDIADIHAVLVTHAHPDHFVDLYSCFYARHYGGLGAEGLPLVCPQDFYGHFGGLVTESGKDVAAAAFDVRSTSPGATHELGPFRVEAFEMEHVGVAALGYRIEADGVALAYTGDSGPSEDVVKMAEGADVFLSEATWQDQPELLPFHMSARQAGEHAERAEVGRLLLTHIWPTLDTSVSLSQAGEAYAGPIELAAEGLQMEVRR